MDQTKFNILFRRPVYPLIVISKNHLRAAFNIKELAICCMSAIPEKDGGVVKAIDSSGEEFWYSPENCVISPGFAFKKWTKKEIIALYNNSDFVGSDEEYSTKSISSKRLDRIISDICELLKSQ
jgi:hypothetical protein